MSASIIGTRAIGIGIDVSKCKLDLAVKLSDLSYLESSFTNDRKGISALCSFLKQQEATCAAPLVIESTGDYHLQSALMIKQRDFNVKLLNPIITRKYQSCSIRNAKNDKIDARRLADIGLLEQAIPDFTGNIDLIKARKLASFLASLEKTKQQLSASLKRFEETAKIIGLRHSCSPTDKALKEIDKEISQINQELTNLLPPKVARLADQTVGLSPKKLAVIYALIGDKEFATDDQLAAFLGMDVAVRQSGRWVGQGRLSKRGNAYARKILYQIAWGLKTHNEIFRDYYWRMRARGKHYTTTLMAVARKFLRYYFAYCIKGTVKLA